MFGTDIFNTTAEGYGYGWAEGPGPIPAYPKRDTRVAALRPESLLESHRTIMWRIIVPLIMPSLMFAGIWTALLTFREVTMALFLSEIHNRVLSVSIWHLWQNADFGIAAAGAVMMVSFMGVLVLVTLKLIGRTPVGQ